ncbi:hypothetical protein OH76DRAFT_1247100 [Lentinus brumalis]|uniref:Uncharacterized protein n=1 Tax=Lentinus brumalis TaxID=2498619 RepID=A0A371CRZ0_9APHY|nr:hypothetical protein OH76DRAFT_1247100 [Polyporus brumalis]
MSPPSTPTSTEASQPRTLVNRVLLAFYAHLVASNFVWYGEHKGCCDGVKMDHFGLRCVDDNRSPDDLLLDSVLIIVSLTLGRRPVAIVRDPQSTHLELLIASKEAVSPTQRSDIERCFTLLAQILPVDGPSGDARDGRAELLTHAYGTCSSEVVKII